ncbi:formylglycine-generating enzyme family protein [Dapis sp. BLCC M229]|uniref:formylglycine-generating enzyme family protein n=1 Tax=Dapis sp. BLCC M229 TaxID=3400188 RepID=UPI003CFAC4FC
MSNRRNFINFLGIAGLSLSCSLFLYKNRASQKKSNISNTSNNAFEFETLKVDLRGNKTERQRLKVSFIKEYLDSEIFIEMVSIPSGTFRMGSPKTEGKRLPNEGPQHQVTIALFFMSKYPITQAQWQIVASKFPQINIPLNPNISKFKGEYLPVESISWYEANEFCARISQKTAKNYRLPSEAEWEYACRANTTTPFYFGETITTNLANYNGNSNYGEISRGVWRRQTTQVGSFPGNAFGLYDLHGNVWEWCADDWHSNYNFAPSDGRIWKSESNSLYKVLRGGSWNIGARRCRSASRYALIPDSKDNFLGFRVVFSNY